MNDQSWDAEQRRRAAVLGVFLAVLLVASVAAVVLGGTSVPAVSPGPSASSAGGEQFGVNVQYLFNDRPTFEPALGAQLSALRATGATIARTDAFWEASEPLRPAAGIDHYVWTFDDQIAGALAQYGLRWLPVLDYSAPWAASIPGNDHSPPVSDGEYADYAAAFAARYGARGSFWRSHPGLTAEPIGTFEIWNEPDQSGFWLPESNAAAYAQLYARARDAIDAVEPGAHVIVGGLSKPTTFLPAMLRADPGLRGHVDGVAIHPYGPTPAAVLASVRYARTTLDALGMSAVPLYVTEFGWPTQPAGTPNWAPESVRPSYIARAIEGLGHSFCGVAMALLYTWVTPEQNPSAREQWFGIEPPSGAASADVSALSAALHADAQAGTPASCAG